MEEKKKTKEIDILALVGKVINERELLLRFVIAGMIVGIIVAFSIPKVFKSEVILAPELSSGGLGLSDNLADMAANFGFDVGGKSSMDAIYPELYPDIFNSTEFITKLFDVPVRLKKDNKTRTYVDHITKEQRIPFWQYPKAWLSELFKPKDGMGKGKEDCYKMSIRDYDIYKHISSSIVCTIDKKTSVISIIVADQDPLVAAIVADTIQQRLQAYITNYRTKKARTDYDYYNKLTEQAKNEYEKTRQRYASLSDANSKVALRSVELLIEDIENDMQLKFNTYTTLNTQLQAAKAKVQEKTPAFTIIQPPIMNHKASSMPRSMIILLFMLLAGCCDALWILYGRSWYQNRKETRRKS